MSTLALPNPPSRFSIFTMQSGVVFITYFLAGFIGTLATLYYLPIPHSSVDHHFHLLSIHNLPLYFILAFLSGFAALLLAISVSEYGWDQVVNESLSSASTFSDCNAVYQWIQQHPEVQPYVDAVKAQGRMLYLGDMLSLEVWVRELEQLREKEKMIEHQREFCKRLYS